MKKRPHKPVLLRFARQTAEAALAYLAMGILRLMPLDQASALGGWLGRTFGPHLRVSRRAAAGLRIAFPGISDAEIRRIIGAMWDNFARIFTEFPHLKEIVDAENGRVTLVGADNVLSIKAPDQAVILIAGHLANWEIIPATLARHLGIELTIVVREPNNPLVRGILRRLRGVAGGRLVPKGAAGASRLLKTVSRGGKVLLLVDQKMSDGMAVPFFGVEAMTAAAPARLALKFHCPVVPLRVERLGGARFRVTCYPMLPLPNGGDSRANRFALASQMNCLLEGWIRERPEDWFWLHRRWPAEAYEAVARSNPTTREPREP